MAVGSVAAPLDDDARPRAWIVRGALDPTMTARNGLLLESWRSHRAVTQWDPASSPHPTRHPSIVTLGEQLFESPEHVQGLAMWGRSGREPVWTREVGLLNLGLLEVSEIGDCPRQA